MFPRRNRIVTGFSKGVIIVEAELRSGSLISARLALEQGRDVYSVPGPIDVPTSIGTNKIISEGGQIIVSIESLLELIVPVENRRNVDFSDKQTLQKQIEIIKIPLSKEEERLVTLMSNNYYTFEELIELTNIEAGNLRQMLGVLALKDVLKEIDGTYGR
jgi:DNA processing protein